MSVWGLSLAATIPLLWAFLASAEAAVSLHLDASGRNVTARAAVPASTEDDPAFLVLRAVGGLVSAAQGERNTRDSLQSWVIRWDPPHRSFDTQVPLILETPSSIGLVIEAQLFSTNGLESAELSLLKKGTGGWEVTTNLRPLVERSARSDGRQSGLARSRPLSDRSKERLLDTVSPILKREGAE